MSHLLWGRMWRKNSTKKETVYKNRNEKEIGSGNLQAVIHAIIKSTEWEKWECGKGQKREKIGTLEVKVQ